MAQTTDRARSLGAGSLSFHERRRVDAAMNNWMIGEEILREIPGSKRVFPDKNTQDRIRKLMEDTVRRQRG